MKMKNSMKLLILALLPVCSPAPTLPDEEMLGFIKNLRSQIAPVGAFAPQILKQVALTAVVSFSPNYGPVETPQTIRFASYYDISWWNCVAVYSTSFQDVLTQERPVVTTPDKFFIPWSWHTTANRFTCGAQAVAALISYMVPQLSKDVQATLHLIGQHRARVKLDPAIAACSDTDCLKRAAIAAKYDPITMGNIVAKQIYDFSNSDGWNQFGTEECVVNCRPFRDTTNYQPQGAAGFPEAWEPLLEDDGNGFFYKQEHVTPHIGTKGVFRFLPESERARVATDPGYTLDRVLEAMSVIERMKQLDDTKKVEVEVFDNKILVTSGIGLSFLYNLFQAAKSKRWIDEVFGRKGLSGLLGYKVEYERFIHFTLGLTGTDYDAVILAWKEKIAYDLVRPTTVIKRLNDAQITTWAPGGVTTFPARDFEAYIRVMPHTEYVSGSSSIFQAQKDYIESYWSKALGFTDLTFPVMMLPFLPRSSKVEPGVVPEKLTILYYDTIEDMANAGGQSRINGGMHFGAAVPAGEELCSGIGNIATDYIINLLG